MLKATLGNVELLAQAREQVGIVPPELEKSAQHLREAATALEGGSQS